MRRAFFLAYLWIQFLGITLPWARMRLEDLLLPILACMTWKEIRKDGLHESAPLLAFLGYALLATLLHILQAGAPRSAAFEWSVFAYCGILYLAFRHGDLSDTTLWRTGALMIACIFVAWLVYVLSGILMPERAPLFGMVSGKMGETAMPFLSRRFTFLHGNPNMLGNMMALPLLMLVLPFLRGKTPPGKIRLPFTVVLMAAALIPLAFTLSKHLILSLAIVCALLASIIGRRVESPRLQRAVIPCGMALILATGLALETTVLFTTFPVKGHYPFINTVPGMYTIHQMAYWRINTSRLNLFGFPPSEARTLYAKYVNRESARTTLRHYNSEHELDTFCTFMDPHCEYLNLPFLFGFPALVLAIAFLLHVRQRSNAPVLALYFVTALLFSMMWDDILSKRAIWISLALLTPSNHA